MMTALYTLAAAGMTKLNSGELPRANADQAHLITILNIVLTIVGGLSLLMITLSGFRYITSAGDEQKAAKAKNGLTYALVGLVVAVTAESIVLFVGNRLLK
jgi:hypothetical protein